MEECIWPILFVSGQYYSETLIFEVVASSSVGGITEINLQLNNFYPERKSPEALDLP